MLYSCKYCGRIHDKNFICQAKQIANKSRASNRRATQAFEFHKSAKWKKKSISIRKRDNYLCVCCKANMQGTVESLNTDDLSVHHIVPIEEDYSKRLDDDNLITVCSMHHELCESGKITKEQQRKLIPKYPPTDKG